VRNTLHSPTWHKTTIVVRSAVETPALPPTPSVRLFLQRSGKPVTTALASLVGAAKSVRRMLNLPG
jgi:hypothetical protein